MLIIASEITEKLRYFEPEVVGAHSHAMHQVRLCVYAFMRGAYLVLEIDTLKCKQPGVFVTQTFLQLHKVFRPACPHNVSLENLMTPAHAHARTLARTHAHAHDIFIWSPYFFIRSPVASLRQNKHG